MKNKRALRGLRRERRARRRTPLAVCELASGCVDPFDVGADALDLSAVACGAGADCRRDPEDEGRRPTRDPPTCDSKCGVLHADIQATFAGSSTSECGQISDVWHDQHCRPAIRFEWASHK